MQWLKGLGVSAKVAVGAFLMALSVMAYQREKGKVKKWQQTSIDVKNKDVDTGTMTAKAASSQAKLHNARAKEIKKKAEDRITQMGGADEDVADILARWGN